MLARIARVDHRGRTCADEISTILHPVTTCGHESYPPVAQAGKPCHIIYLT